MKVLEEGGPLRSSSMLPDLAVARAHWLTRDLIAWPLDALPSGMNPDSLDWRLHWSATGNINPRAAEPVPWETSELILSHEGLPAALALANPHLRGFVALRLDSRRPLRPSRSCANRWWSAPTSAPGGW